MGARAAGPDSPAEDTAVRAPLYAQKASFAGWTFVNGAGAQGALGDWDRERGMPSSPDRLAASRRADTLATPRNEGLSADRAQPWLPIVTGIVTQRG